MIYICIVCVCVYTGCAYIFMMRDLHTYLCVCVYIMCVYMYTCVVFTHIRVCVCVRVYILCVNDIYICIYIYICYTYNPPILCIYICMMGVHSDEYNLLILDEGYVCVCVCVCVCVLCVHFQS